MLSSHRYTVSGLRGSMSAIVSQVADSRNPTEAEAGLAQSRGIQYQDTVGSPGHQRQNAAGPLERRARNGRTQGSISSLSLFSASFPIFALFFLFNRLAFPPMLLRLPGGFPTAFRVTFTGPASGPVPHLIELVCCQVLLAHSVIAMRWNHIHQHGWHQGLL